MDTRSARIKYVSELLSEMAIILMMNGANTSRTLRNTKRTAEALGYHADLFLSLSGAVLSIRDIKTQEVNTIVRQIPHIGVNFEIVSEISILSWKALREDLSAEKVYEELDMIKKIKPYVRLWVLFFVGLAGAGLCRILEGSWLEVFIAFIATVIGLIVRQCLTNRHFNIFVVFAAASFTAVSVVNIFRIVTELNLNSAFAASVLFLIPGVPLINSFIDILEGYTSLGIFRGVYGGFLILVIAMGLFVSLTIFGYDFG